MASDQTQTETAIRAAVNENFTGTLDDLQRLVRIPSVSWPAFNHEHLRATSADIANMLRETGIFGVVDVRRAPLDVQPEGATEIQYGQPAVVARREPRNGRPTVLLYAHHDVQPPGKDEDWDTPPFEPTERNGRLYGRGAADDKAGVMAHVGAIRALVETAQAEGRELDLGIALFIEGEEEWASQSFGSFLHENRDLLAADAIIVADSGNWDETTPALTVALRGAVAFNLKVETLGHASHSGMFGGAVPDAMLATVRLLDTLWDADGSVAVEGLVTAEIAAPAYDEGRLREESALLPGVSPIGRGEILSRIWAQPAISITGIDAPDVANASNTLIPSTRVRLSSRIAPGQDPTAAYEAIKSHLEARAPFGAKLTFEDPGLGQAFLVDTSGWAVTEVRQAMADAWEKTPVDMGVGGSIPFIAELVSEFPEAQILVTGVEDPDGRAHSPNESLHIESFRKSVLTEALFLARLDARTNTDA
ncbi:acetylornithine deacetylase/succinyl-diaminopimelate desuccinylase-like protein [Leucobacter exalbidus]|uniref:Acetylornithine deacetylase/succinyl-diaminopimelate desuccinylase-like protein n=1 Tax=Leucobacter exalbidus TaxID=662960 RepID=A0A940T065_9MICO|nr:dipeptidase [Leucobacter exalbidus]MBP1325605.1 acetylornithine deacetylase/succinyl-diaminopimelate desuccinylase-like protein [Leucobacter exalbidus]